MGHGGQLTKPTSSQTVDQKKARGTRAPLELGPGTRAERPADGRKQHTWSPSQTMVKKRRPPVADAGRAGTGNTNRSPSLARQTIENQHKTGTDQGPCQDDLATGTRSTSRSNKALVA